MSEAAPSGATYVHLAGSTLSTRGSLKGPAEQRSSDSSQDQVTLSRPQGQFQRSASCDQAPLTHPALRQIVDAVIRKPFPRVAPALLGTLLVACAALSPSADPDTVLISNDAHSPLTVAAAPSGEQLTVAACSAIVLTLHQAGWRIAIDGRHAFSQEEVVAGGIDRSDRWVRIDVTSNDLTAEVRVGQAPEPQIIAACADV